MEDPSKGRCGTDYRSIVELTSDSPDSMVKFAEVAVKLLATPHDKRPDAVEIRASGGNIILQALCKDEYAQAAASATLKKGIETTVTKLRKNKSPRSQHLAIGLEYSKVDGVEVNVPKENVEGCVTETKEYYMDEIKGKLKFEASCDNRKVELRGLGSLPFGFKPENSIAVTGETSRGSPALTQTHPDLPVEVIDAAIAALQHKKEQLLRE